MNIFIIAGDPSGDEYGAELMKNMLVMNPKINFNGIGGPLMQKQGLNSIVSFHKMAVMGFMEVVKALPFFLNLEKQIIKLIQKETPNKIILIDYPGFNLRICKKIKLKINCQILYYISPQIWAWKEKRINIIKSYVDKMFVIFDFEKKWYAKHNIDVEYFGHPFLDIWDKNNISDFVRKYQLNVDQPILTLFPGSRSQELNKHFNLFIDAALKIKNDIPDLQIMAGIHTDIKPPIINNKDIIIVNDEPLKALEVATCALVASGTATLQAAIMNTPAIVIYKMNSFSWWLTKQLVQVNFASMANIIANELVFPELLQGEANINNITKEAVRIIKEENYKNTIISNMQLIRNKIGGSGASKKIAIAMLNSN